MIFLDHPWKFSFFFTTYYCLTDTWRFPTCCFFNTEYTPLWKFHVLRQGEEVFKKVYPQPNNANSTTSGKCYPLKVFNCLSKQLPFHHLPFCLTKHINNEYASECCFICKSNWNLGNCSIDKDMPFDILTYMTFTISFSVIAFFHWNSLVKVSHNAECNMTKTLRVFIIRLVACEITAKHEIIFGLDNSSKALHILRNHLVRLKACLENQVSCTGLMILK